MKKYFCFNCQKDIIPRRVWKWRFCPHCYRRVIDDGSGFYLVCDRCGANMPANAENCSKCGHGFYGHADNKIPVGSRVPSLSKSTVLSKFIDIVLFVLGIVCFLLLLYIMSYVAVMVILAIAIYITYDFLRSKI